MSRFWGIFSQGKQTQDLQFSPDWVCLIWVGSLAQLVEQETLNLLVIGSNPIRPTNPNCINVYEFMIRNMARIV